MSVDNETLANPMTQLDYAERKLEDRDTGTQSASALLSGLACGLGVLSLWAAPMILGFIAIGCAILGLSMAGTRDRIGKIGLIIAVLGWLLGSIISIIVGHSVISLNIS
jgi:4-amino-4-deoxy-L-arabinose transferase-like glycosyltransferase